MDDIGDEYYGFERQTDRGWEYIDMEDIKEGDIFRYTVGREHEYFGLMFKAARDAFEAPDGDYQIKAAAVMADPTRKLLH